MTAPLLSAQRLLRRFGGLIAVNEVDLEVEPGEIQLVIGPNGAGKTTFFNLVSGVDRPDGGTVTVDGVDLTGRPAHVFAAAGLMRTFQHARPFKGLDLVENVMVGGHSRTAAGSLRGTFRTPAARREEKELRQEAHRLLGEVGLDKTNRLAGELTLAEERRLELARCLAGEPRLLLLDEPAAGLGDEEAEEVAALVKRIRDERGVAVILIEHHIELALSVAEQVSVLDFGRVIARGSPEAVRNDPKVIEAYIGAAT